MIRTSKTRTLHVKRRTATAVCFILLLSLSTTIVVTTDAVRAETGYTKYPSYPEYCSSPDMMTARVVPPLRSDAATGVVHVTAVIRHGQRTPYAGNMECWSGYRESVTWDCDLATWTGPASPGLVFEKRYDALPAGGNILGGSCLLGQLVDEGYEQEAHNGRLLRDAYFDALFRGTNTHNETDAPRPWESPYSVYRVDDEQRTLLSGEVLLRELFQDGTSTTTTTRPATMTLHTADYSVDVLTPNESVCPGLTKLRQEAYRSQEFQAFNSSQEARELRDFLTHELGGRGRTNSHGEWEDQMDDILDCLMTTMCTDQQLPDLVNDFGRQLSDDGRKGMFERLIDFSTWKYTYFLRYNDAAYSKLGMGPLWYEILDKIRPLGDVPRKEGGTYFSAMYDLGIPRLALYSGHDSTLMPLLASLGEDVYDGKDWSPYASMVVLEVHEIKEQDENNPLEELAFRLLYNGEVLTERLDGCPAGFELCDLSVLFDIVGPFATFDRPQCAVSDAKLTSSFLATNFEDRSEKMAVLFIALASLILGWFGTYVVLMKKMPFPKRGRNKAVFSDTAEFGELS